LLLDRKTTLVLITLSFVLLFMSAALPFLMILDLIQTTLFLNFLAGIFMIIGMYLGLIGIAQYYPRR